MLEKIIKEHSGEIKKLLTNKFGLSGDQASGATNNIIQAVISFFSSQMASGKLDLSHVTDLFNKNTSNQGNALFSGLGNAITGALSSSDISQETISNISTNGLDDIIKIFQGGKLGNIDLNKVTSIIGSITGKSGGGIGGFLGKLFGRK